jgi:hypothetical protein
VAKLAVRFVVKQARAERHILGVRLAETKDDHRHGDHSLASLHERVPKEDGRKVM